MNKLIDTHAHLYAAQFEEDREAMINRALQAGVEKIFLPNIDLESIKGMHDLLEKFPGICYPMMGLHPCDVKEDFKTVLAKIEKELFENLDKYIAVGETGIDLFWDKTTLDWQVQAFEIQISWCQQTGLPIVIHARDSIDELITLLEKQKNKQVSGVFHCFTGNQEQAKKILNLGFYLGLGGVLTFKNSPLAEVVRDLPMDRLILETDSPYLAPTPHRGKRNESTYVQFVAQKLAEIKDISLAQVAQETSANALRLFNKVK